MMDEVNMANEFRVQVKEFYVPRVLPSRHFLLTNDVLVGLTLRLLMSYIYGAPSKARNANVVYIWT